jgi:hypothetical protein
MINFRQSSGLHEQKVHYFLSELHVPNKRKKASSKPNIEARRKILALIVHGMMGRYYASQISWRITPVGKCSKNCYGVKQYFLPSKRFHMDKGTLQSRAYIFDVLTDFSGAGGQIDAL